MFDFRYHALSLVAVFLALAIGILLGATIGNSLVSDADKGLRSSRWWSSSRLRPASVRSSISSG